jgi:hypothetical protein
MIVGNATQGLPIFLTMARGGWSRCHMNCDVHFRSKTTSTIKPWGHGTKSYANFKLSHDWGSTVKISVTIDFNKIKHDSKNIVSC